MEEDKAKVIERVRKLLALSSSPNEYEAALAAEKAHTILAQHNLTMASVRAGSLSADRYIMEGYDTPASKWIGVLLNALAKLYFTEYVHMKLSPTMDRHIFVGEEASTRVAVLMSDYMISAVLRLTPDGTLRFKESFWLGCATRLHLRIVDRMRESAAGTASNLPALANLYLSTNAKLSSLIEQALGANVRRETLPANPDIDSAAFVKGLLAGADIGLDQQVAAQEPPKAIEG